MGDNSNGIKPFCGIKNPGQTCFANSVIQLLWRIPEFKKCVLDSVDSTSTDLMKSFKPFFERLNDALTENITFTSQEWLSFYDAIEKTYTTPTAFGVQKDDKGGGQLTKKSTPQYKQEDAAELLNKIIENINCDTKFLQIATNDITYCSDGRMNINTQPPLNVIDVNIPDDDETNIQELFENRKEPIYYTEDQKNKGENIIDSCRDNTAIYRQYEIQITDQKYMLVQINRWNAYMNKRFTVVKPSHVIYIHGKKLHLKCGILHRGGSLASGHYNFIEYNDEGHPKVVIDDARLHTSDSDIAEYLELNTRKHKDNGTFHPDIAGYIFLYEIVGNGSLSLSDVKIISNAKSAFFRAYTDDDNIFNKLQQEPVARGEYTFELRITDTKNPTENKFIVTVDKVEYIIGENINVSDEEAKNNFIATLIPDPKGPFPGPKGTGPFGTGPFGSVPSGTGPFGSVPSGTGTGPFGTGGPFGSVPSGTGTGPKGTGTDTSSSFSIQQFITELNTLFIDE
jgi:hypothetical protein